jgi:hypothetical protein
MSVNDAILSNLQKAMKANRPLDLLSSFRGVPVRYKASIQQIQGEVVTVQALPPEAVCLELEREVVVLGEGVEEALRADVVGVQLTAGTAHLTHLRYADDRLGNRLMVRVEPKEPMLLRLEVGGQTFQGQLVDISMGGLAIQMLPVVPDLLLKTRAPVRLAFNLPSGPIELVGIIRSVKPTTDGKRLGVAFPQDAQLSAIVGFILQRRVEILAELKSAYEARVGEKK